MSFKKRLLICFSVVAIVPMLIASAWLLLQSIQTTTRQYEQSSKQLLETKKLSLDMMFETTQSNILEILSSPELILLLNGLRKDQTIQNVESEYEQVKTKLSSLQVLGSDLFQNMGVYSLDVNRTVVYSYYPDHTVSKFYEEAAEAEGKLLWKVEQSDGETPKIYMVGAALLPGNGKVVGIAFLELRYNRLMELIQPVQERSMEQNFLIADGQTIAASQNTSESRNLLEQADVPIQPAEPVIERFCHGGEAYFVGTVATTLQGWDYVTMVPVSYLTSEMYQNVKPIFYLTIVTLVVSTVLALVLRKSAYQPISHLAKLLDGIDRDSLDLQVDSQKDDELNQLAGSLSQMMSRIQSLIAEVEREKEAKFSAEMAALKAQINPHFLYNTLNMIKCLTASGNLEDAERVCVCLIRLLRTSIGNNHECISLEEELSYIKNYAEILHFRMDKQFELINDVPQKFDRILIPKFTLQPIVENCIIHGFEEETEYNSIVITAKIHENIFEISVTDNGKGIQPRKVRELEYALNHQEGLKFSHVGIQNVHERIRHIYGNEYGLKIQSFENDGTRVTACFPIRWAEDTEG